MASAGRAILLPYQQRWVNDRAPLKVWLAARQIGKSFALAMEAVAEALSGRCNNLILSSSLRQSREVMRKVYSHLRCLSALSADAIRAEREKSDEVTLPNGSRIISLPASPDTVRGFSGNVFLDEFAFHTDAREIWRAMYPTVTRGYKVRVASSPNGRQNMFYRLYSDEAVAASRHRTDIHTAAAEGLKVDIGALRAGIGDPEAWAQEFECAFIDEATAFITYEQIASCEDAEVTTEFEGTPGAGAEFYLGVDVGRRRDLTVFWLLQKLGDVLWTRMVRVMRNTPFRAQADFLHSLLGGAGLRRACLDASGIGMQLAEEASARFGKRAESVTFTPAVKEDLAFTLRRNFEERLIRVPAERDIREDIHSVCRGTTAAGNVRFDAERSEGLGHADRFWALALAVHASSASLAPVSYERVSARRPALEGPVFDRKGCW